MTQESLFGRMQHVVLAQRQRRTSFYWYWWQSVLCSTGGKVQRRWSEPWQNIPPQERRCESPLGRGDGAKVTGHELKYLSKSTYLHYSSVLMQQRECNICTMTIMNTWADSISTFPVFCKKGLNLSLLLVRIFRLHVWCRGHKALLLWQYFLGYCTILSVVRTRDLWPFRCMYAAITVTSRAGKKYAFWSFLFILFWVGWLTYCCWTVARNLPKNLNCCVTVVTLPFLRLSLNSPNRIIKWQFDTYWCTYYL